MNLVLNVIKYFQLEKLFSVNLPVNFVKRGMERSRDKKTAIPLFGSEWQSLID